MCSGVTGKVPKICFWTTKSGNVTPYRIMWAPGGAARGTVKARLRLRSILSAPFSELVAFFFKGGRAPSFFLTLSFPQIR